MSNNKKQAVQAALRDVQNGMSAYKAAKLHGVAQSSISRAKARLKRICPTCGK